MLQTLFLDKAMNRTNRTTCSTGPVLAHAKKIDWDRLRIDDNFLRWHTLLDKQAFMERPGREDRLAPVRLCNFAESVLFDIHMAENILGMRYKGERNFGCFAGRPKKISNRRKDKMGVNYLPVSEGKLFCQIIDGIHVLPSDHEVRSEFLMGTLAAEHSDIMAVPNKAPQLVKDKSLRWDRKVPEEIADPERTLCLSDSNTLRLQAAFVPRDLA